MKEKEEKEGIKEEKKDSLMWSEEDYDAMQKLTGFDDESVLEDQKKGINLIIFFVVCIVSLIAGILIGYNINKKDPVDEPTVTVIQEIEEKKVETLAVYNRLNESGELYLYTLNSENEEISILDLTNSKYAYQYIGDELYVLLEKDGLNLYNYSFSKDGYHRDLVKKFEEDYNAFYFKNDLILIKTNNGIKFYDKDANALEEIKVAVDQILDYTKDYIVYSKDSKLYLYYIKTATTKKITKRTSEFLYLDNDVIFYIERNRIYTYSIIGDVSKELTSFKSNSIFTKINDNYMFNDGKTLYSYNKEIKKVKEFEFNINELAYLNQNTIIFILDDYNSTECLMNDKSFWTLNLFNQSMSEQNISGCLNTKVINGLIKVKQK